MLALPLSDTKGGWDDLDAPCPSEKPRPHDIVFLPESRIIADSVGLGWSDAYASITARRAWTGRIDPIGHVGIGYCLRGTNTIERSLEGERSTLHVTYRARALALLPTHASAWFRVSGDADVLVIYLRAGMVRAAADRLFGASTKPLHLRPAIAFSDPLLEQICLSFAAALHRRDPGAARYMDQLAECAAAHCLVHYGAEGAVALPPRATDLQAALGRLTAYVDDNLDGDLSVEALAQAAGLTVAGVKRAFAEVYDTTPRQWVIRRRIAGAERLLAVTDLPLAEIALSSGFASQSHLSSMFKREIGRTPREYRRSA